MFCKIDELLHQYLSDIIRNVERTYHTEYKWRLLIPRRNVNINTTCILKYERVFLLGLSNYIKFKNRYFKISFSNCLDYSMHYNFFSFYSNLFRLN